MITSTELRQLSQMLLGASLLKEQTATLKRILCNTSSLLPVEMVGVYSDMLRYTHFLGFRHATARREYILQELTETELQAYLDLVESANAYLKVMDYHHSRTPYDKYENHE